MTKKFLTVFIALMLTLNTFAIRANAESNFEQVNESIQYNSSKQIRDDLISLDDNPRDIIGGSYPTASIQKNVFENLLTVDFKATATAIFITYNNIGVDSIDQVYSSVTINGVTKNVPPFRAKVGTTSKKIAFDMKKCHEEVSVITNAKDGGDSIGRTKTSGERNLPKDLLNLWHRGNFSSSAASLEYHFNRHGFELNIHNIQSYVQSANNFRKNLSGASTSKVAGTTPNVKRYKKNNKYIDVCGPKKTGKIISYGRQ